MQDLKGKTIIGIIIVLAILAIILFFQQNNNRVLNMYNKIINSQEYIFSMEEVSADIKYRMSVAKKNNDINIEVNSNEEHTSTLVSKGSAYFIMHDEKEYYEYDSDDIDGDIIISGLKDAVEKKYTSGTESIYGEKYYYEEFEDILTFLILLKSDEDALVKTKFYFKGDKIEYIKNTIYHDDGTTEEELLKVDLNYTVDASMFEIPEDYAEMENNN